MGADDTFLRHGDLYLVTLRFAAELGTISLVPGEFRFETREEACVRSLRIFERDVKCPEIYLIYLLIENNRIIIQFTIHSQLQRNHFQGPRVLVNKKDRSSKP